MALPKIRNLGQPGVITDIDPYDLPPTAFSFAKNVRFRNNRVTSGPVFKIAQRLQAADPRFVFSVQANSGQDFLFTGYNTGRVYRVQSGSETDYSITGFTNSVAEGVWSSAFTADVLYVNREDRAPWLFTEANSQFSALANWPSNTTCKLLRQCGGALVALNVTEGGTSSPTMVKTSSFALAGQEPLWVFTAPGTGAVTEATENILADMEGGIVDACTLGNDLIIYGLKQAYRMTADFSGLVWDYPKLPFQKGALNANCSIEINSKNYVFGLTDIWVHDGVSEQSVCDQVVRDFIYGSINLSKASRCYVFHNPALFELHFCYCSNDAYAVFNNPNDPDGCNRSAVLNYKTNTWVFQDLPLTYAAAWSNMDTGTQTYATTSWTYQTASGTYADQQDSIKRVSVTVGNTAAAEGLTSTLYAYDIYGTGSVVGFPVDATATQTPYLERTGIDLDEAFDLEGYKQFNYIVPQARLDPGTTATLDFSVGSSESYVENVVWDDWMSYDGMANYKIDMNESGKYLAIRVRFLDYRTFTLSGYDLSLQETGTKN